MGSRSGEEPPGPSETKDEDWEREQIERVAARFPQMDTEELQAELAVTLFKLKRVRPPGIRDWKAYVAVSLSHRASSLAQKWRTQWRREVSADADPNIFEQALPSEELDTERIESRQVLSRVRHALDPESYAFLKLFAEADGNLSRLARWLGKHRNTIRRRLQQIRRTLRRCPIEHVTARLRLTSRQREYLTRTANTANARARDAFKARLILALASGQSYSQIAKQLHTTRPTIARWKRRFQEKDVDGLKGQYQGKRPRTELRTRLRTWLRSNVSTGFSCRKIARDLGMSKSTVHRILREGAE